MRFLIDAQLPPRHAQALIAQGHDASHVFALGLSSASDQHIWNEATALGAALVTKDQDFAILRSARDVGPTIVWIRMGNTDNDTLIRRVVAALGDIVRAVERGERVVEIVAR